MPLPKSRSTAKEIQSHFALILSFIFCSILEQKPTIAVTECVNKPYMPIYNHVLAIRPAVTTHPLR